MGSNRKNENTANPIAAKLVGKMKRALNGKVVNLRSFVAGRAAAEELQKQVVTEQLAGCHPAHAAYVYAQNQVSVMSEQLTGLKEMAPFAHIVSEAEDLYMPSAPPMSPLTTSYFTCDAERDGVVCLQKPMEQDADSVPSGGRQQCNHIIASGLLGPA